MYRSFMEVRIVGSKYMVTISLILTLRQNSNLSVRQLSTPDGVVEPLTPLLWSIGWEVISQLNRCATVRGVCAGRRGRLFDPDVTNRD